MPCYDGPRPEDLERERLMAGALAAMLCGMFKQDEQAAYAAAGWCSVHELVDKAIAKWGRYSREAGSLQRGCDEILIEFNIARGAVQRRPPL